MKLLTIKNRFRMRAITFLVLAAMLLQVFPPILAQSAKGKESYVSAGMREFKNSFSGVGTPGWLLGKFGVEMGYHLVDCATNGEKPSVVKVVKSMATADYLARTAGGLLGGAAGSVFVPFLSAVPVFGGLLANFVPTFTYYLGADMAGEGLAGLKNGKFSFKNYFKTLDWTAMLAGSAGWTIGSMLGSAVFPPIGSIVGGMLGDIVATKLLEKFRKWRSGSDSSPPLMPTGTGGPIRTIVNKGGYAPTARPTLEVPVNGSAFNGSNTARIIELSARYDKLYELYQQQLSANDVTALQKTGQELNLLKSQLEKARKGQ
jgi:hypothetical protein